jgi:UDP-3-O-[3-hydroxymyristoyl] glucosamine N-acyltransferase
LSFLANPKYGAIVGKSGAAAVIVAEHWVGTADCVLVRAKSPDKAMARAYQDVIPPGPDQSYPTTKSKSLKLMADRKPARVLSPTMFARPM